MKQLVFPRLYAIMSADLLSESALEVAEALANGGVGLIQYRDKNATTATLLSVSGALSSMLRPRCVQFILNDRLDIALLSGAGGVHLGQTDLAVEDARAICGPEKWIGISTHNAEQVRVAAATSADYIAVGPIYPTRTKKNAEAVTGLDLVKSARRITQKPVVAIGGITLDNARAVFEAGADCVAVARELVANPEPRQRAEEFLCIAADFGRLA